MLKRVLVFAYGVVCYAIFLVTFLYALGFVGNFVVPVTLDGVPRLAHGPGAGHRPGAARRSSPCSTASWRARSSSAG